MRPVQRAGLTRIELLSVIAVISVVAGTAIPNILGALPGDPEDGALASLRALATSSHLYRNRFGEFPGASSGDPLGDLSHAALRPTPYIDPQLGSGQKGGYLYMFVTAGDQFGVTADPVGVETGTRSFFVDQSGVIRVEADFAANGSATASSPPLD